MLFEKLSEGHYADSQYFALAFLWRQAVELELKALHGGLDELDGVRRWSGPPRKFDPKKHPELSPPLAGHDLQVLWNELQPRLEEVFPGMPEHAMIRRVIEQFHAVDPTAEHFRYPTKMKDGSRTLDRLPRQLSLSDLQTAMARLMSTLDGAAGEVQSRLEYTREGEALDRARERETER